MQRVLGAVIKWRRHLLRNICNELIDRFNYAKKLMEKTKVKLHDILRIWVVVITALSIMLVHFSKALRKEDVVNLLGQ